MAAASAQYVEPKELRMLRESMAETLNGLQRAEFSLLLAAKEIQKTRERTNQLDAWVKAVDLHIEQEAAR